MASSYSGSSDSDNGFEQDIEALRRACSVTGLDNNNNDHIPNEDEDEDDDIEMLRNIRKRFCIPDKDVIIDDVEHVSTKPLNIILPGEDDDDEDYGGDFETLRAIQQRFQQYNDSMNEGIKNFDTEQVGATNNIHLGNESSPHFFNNNQQGFPDCVDGGPTNQNFDTSINITPPGTSYPDASEGHEPTLELVPVGDGGFPTSAQAFVEAIKKNRLYQKFLRNKLIQIEARLEENKKLRERVKILKDLQLSCRKNTGRALSQKRDPRIQLISLPKQRANASKAKDKKRHPMYHGPAENPQVANYRAAVSKYAFSLSREPWSKEEKKNLAKGIKQQIQETMMQDLLSRGDANSSDLDSMIKRIRDRRITPEEIRSFIPKINWGQLSSMYLPGRSGPECESRWRNCEDPLINHKAWTSDEEKKLLHCVSDRGFSNWIDIAEELKTNRTPFQCLSRYQRSLNASVINNEWTSPEDEALRMAVAEYGETNWQLVASTLSGRTGTQCSNRWKRSLNPRRERVGRWDPDEDKRLKIVVRLFGAKNWNKIAKFVPGRTQVQCRERWVNCLDPSLNLDKWTEEEDLKLKAAIEEHNYCWSRIAACIPPRTDSQCRRRWKALLPDQVLMLKAARKVKKNNFVSNFVDREEERPTLSYKDLMKPKPHLLESGSKANEDNITSKNRKRRSVGNAGPRKLRKISQIEKVGKAGSRKVRKVTDTEKVWKLTDEDEVVDNDGQADVTSNGEGLAACYGGDVGNDNQANDEGPTACHGDLIEIKKEATGKIKERSAPKIRSRRARQVTHTAKVSNLLEEDDVHANIITNERSALKNVRRSLKNKADTSSGNIEHDHGEGIRTSNEDNSVIKRKAVRKRKQRCNDEHEELDETWEPNPISKKKTTKKSRDCGLSLVVAEPLPKDVQMIGVSHEDDAVILTKDIAPTGVPQFRTLRKCRASPKPTNGSHTDVHTPRKSHIKNSERDKEVVAEPLPKDVQMIGVSHEEDDGLILTKDIASTEVPQKPLRKCRAFSKRTNGNHTDVHKPKTNRFKNSIREREVVAEPLPKDVQMIGVSHEEDDGGILTKDIFAPTEVPQFRTLRKCRASSKPTNGNHTDVHKPKKSRVKNNLREREVVTEPLPKDVHMVGVSIEEDDSVILTKDIAPTDVPQFRTLGKCRASSKRTNGNPTDVHEPKKSCIKNSIRKREAEKGSGDFGAIVIQLEEEETFANILSKLKKRRVNHMEE